MEFNINDASHIFNKLSTFYDARMIEEWKGKVKSDLDELFIKYKVNDYKLNKNSYMGIVLDCQTYEDDSIFIKIVPPMTGRFNFETGTLKRLSNDIICEIYEINPDKNAIIMEKIIPGDLAEFEDNKQLFLKFFEKIYNNKIEIDDEIENQYRNFDEVVEFDYNVLLKTEYDYRIPEILFEKFKKEYARLVNENKRFLLHGDIYKNNALISENGIKIIDPLGFKAPFVMELVSICAYEMLNNNLGRKNSDIAQEFTDYFSEFVDADTYNRALFCQLVKVYIPSIFEANDGGVRAGKWLNIIKELYPEIKLGEN